MKMNKILKLSLICFFAFQLSAQEKALEGITSFKVKNSGALKDENNDIDGYYFFYEVDELRKGEIEFAIKIMDDDFNEVAKKSYIDSDDTYLIKSVFNNKALIFAFVDNNEKSIKLVNYNRKGVRGKDKVILMSKKDFTNLASMFNKGHFNSLFPVNNKGYIFTYMTKQKKYGYSLEFVPTNGGKAWSYKSPTDATHIELFSVLKVSEQYIVGLRFSQKSMLSAKNSKTELVVIDVNNGKEIFTKEYKRDIDSRLITNAIVTSKGEIAVLGEYHKEGVHVLKSVAEGLFMEVFKKDGTLVVDKKIQWSEINKKIPTAAKKDNEYIYFHDMILTEDNRFYCIGELYSLTTGVSKNGKYLSELEVTNGLIFELDNQFNLENVKTIKKSKTNTISYLQTGTPQMKAQMMSNTSAFDYLYTQIDKDKNRFYTTFYDYEKVKGKDDKSLIKSVIYNNGNLSDDKLYFGSNDNSTSIRFLPAKLGYIAFLKYNKKTKMLTFRKEKLNVE